MREENRPPISALLILIGCLAPVGFYLATGRIQTNNDKNQSASHPTPGLISDISRPLTYSTFACISINDLQHIKDLIDQKDETALQTLQFELFSQGKCKLLMADAQVYITDHSFWTGAVQVRPRGDPTKYWVPPNVFDPRPDNKE